MAMSSEISVSETLQRSVCIGTVSKSSQVHDGFCKIILWEFFPLLTQKISVNVLHIMDSEKLILSTSDTEDSV